MVVVHVYIVLAYERLNVVLLFVGTKAVLMYQVPRNPLCQRISRSGTREALTSSPKLSNYQHY